jgi:hypothetical protein
VKLLHLDDRRKLEFAVSPAKCDVLASESRWFSRMIVPTGVWLNRWAFILHYLFSVFLTNAACASHLFVLRYAGKVKPHSSVLSTDRRHDSS